MMSEKYSFEKRMALKNIYETILMCIIVIAFYVRCRSISIIIMGVVLVCYTRIMKIVGDAFLFKEINKQVNELCSVINNMKNKEQTTCCVCDDEKLLSKVCHHLEQLYQIMREDKESVDCERKELQMLVSDLSHQIKTPLSNVRMIVDTVLIKQIPKDEEHKFLCRLKEQVNKLEFLFESMIKTSRLETGMIHMTKEPCNLYDTIGQAVGTVIYRAEEKKIGMEINCPYDISVSHDSKWTAEAIFNVLDNAVKYTPEGGRVQICVERLEMYVRVVISDTGKGIAKDHYGLIFQRFYREPDVHDKPGVGVGLYLTREIIIRQGGFVTVNAKEPNGSVFSIYIPYR